MYCIYVVKIGNRFCDLLEDSASCCFSYYAVWKAFRVLLEGDALHIVSDNIDLLRCINKIVKFNYTWMLQALQDSDLSLTSLFLHRIGKTILFIYFNRIFQLISLIET